MRLFDLIVVPPISLIALWKARGLASADRRDRVLWAMWAMFAVSFVIGVPAVRRVIDEAVGVRSVTNLLVHILALCAVTAFFEFVREATEAPGRLSPLRWAFLAGSTLGLTGLFAAMPRPDGEADLLTANVGQPLTDAYWAVFLGYISIGCVIGTRLCWQYGRHAMPGSSRTFMTLVGLAKLAGLLYVVQRSVYLLLGTLGWRNLDPALAVATTQVLLAACVLLMITGMTWPSLSELIRRRRAWRQVRAIRPLWNMVKAATPETVLPLPRKLRSEPDLVLYRYVIEIHDGVLALDRHLSPSDRDEAERMLSATMPSGTDLDAAVEAVLLSVALQANLVGAAPRGTGSALTLGSKELTDEIDWCRKVAAKVRSERVTCAARSLRPAGDRLCP
ncbi:MAB_1171c family putative transporter [Kitasatospora sp. NPDC101447]|uniref:MAB_1171c family putative transporter n=1 Tax=Kitasatospora sp. NPDC101447 TaxID=3364102 RepID=UPI0037FD1169